MAGRELPLRFDWSEIPIHAVVRKIGWDPAIGQVPTMNPPPFALKASYAIWDFAIMAWDLGYTPTRRGVAPWIMKDGRAITPIFFDDPYTLIEWLRSPEETITFGQNTYELVWAESAERAEHLLAMGLTEPDDLPEIPCEVQWTKGARLKPRRG